MERLNYPPGDVRIQTLADMRYVGQAFNLTVDLTDMLADSENLLDHASASFAAQHERIYGHRADDDPLEVVNLRIRAAVDTPSIWPEPPELNSETSGPVRASYDAVRPGIRPDRDADYSAIDAR